MSEISSSEFLRIYDCKSKDLNVPVALDVRSPGEFALGHLPQTANAPILTDIERHDVGWTYKNQGQEAAIQLGFSLVTPQKEERVSSWTKRIGASPEKVIFCWRGGLRSKIAQEWLHESGVFVRRIKGGYKAVRLALLETLENPPPLVVLGGMTGSGKTRLLQTVNHALDLEGLAHHRGSAFGLEIGEKQPAQSTFENALAIGFLQKREAILVEDESRNIGRIRVPDAVYGKMSSAPMIWIESSVHERASEIYTDYVLTQAMRADFAEVETHFQNCLQKIERKIGGLRFQQALKLLKEAFAATRDNGWCEEIRELHILWIEFLLREYYDQMYQFAMVRKQRKIIFKGSWQECLLYSENLRQSSIYESKNSKL